jgi:predicted NodU family carbamoyl transferase
MGNGAQMLTLGVSGHFGSADADMIPGLHKYYAHDAAACLVSDGELIAAAEEERFNRIKHTNKFPGGAIRSCLQQAQVQPEQIDAVGYYFANEFVDLTLKTLYAIHPRVPVRYAREIIGDKLREEFGIDLPDERIMFATHHIAHAWSTFVRSGMEDALVVVLDGRGEEVSGTIFQAEPGELRTLHSYSIPQSLGLFYQVAIGLVGYGFGDEYKVMGLAPYGNSETYRAEFQSLYTLHENGEYELVRPIPEINPVARPFFRRGFIPRRAGQKMTQQHMDFAAGLQEMLETVAMHIVTHWAKETCSRRLCFTGGVAHNSSLNGVILRSGLFEDIFVHPASHDGGAAEGAAIVAAEALGAAPKQGSRLRTASLGTDLGSADEIERSLRAWDQVVEIERQADIVSTAAQLLADGAVLGWAQGRAEFGPRALGNRSIIADARPATNRDRINAMVKKREAFRPFAPAVTPEAAERYFDLTGTRADHEFMSFVVHVRQNRRAELGAVTHIDGTARLQIVDPETNERFYDLITKFGQLTGTPVLLNTSFNNNAEPIVDSVADAVAGYLTTELDYLVVDEFLIKRRGPVTCAVEGLVISFRPVTRLVEERMQAGAGPLKVSRAVYLDYSSGPRIPVSATMFDLLTAVDGTSTAGALAARHTRCGLSDDLRHELVDLWQRRLIVLAPPGIS